MLLLSHYVAKIWNKSPEKLKQLDFNGLIQDVCVIWRTLSINRKGAEMSGCTSRAYILHGEIFASKVWGNLSHAVFPPRQKFPSITTSSGHSKSHSQMGVFVHSIFYQWELQQNVHFQVYQILGVSGKVPKEQKNLLSKKPGLPYHGAERRDASVHCLSAAKCSIAKWEQQTCAALALSNGLVHPPLCFWSCSCVSRPFACDLWECHSMNYSIPSSQSCCHYAHRYLEVHSADSNGTLSKVYIDRGHHRDPDGALWRREN